MVKERNCNMDLLKLIACIAVIGLHTFSTGKILYYLCGFAVPIFFMVSGYFLLDKQDVTWKYIMKKIASIFRVVLGWNVLRFGLSYLECLLLQQDISTYSFTNFCKELLKCFIQEGKMWQMWYLGALIIIYMILPLLHKMITKRSNKRIWKVPYAVIIWGILVAISMIWQSASMFYGKPLQSYIIQTFRVWSWLQYFILGGILSFLRMNDIFSKLSERSHSMILAFSTAFVICYQYIVGKYVIHIDYAEFFYDSVFTIIWLVILFSRVLRIKISGKKAASITKICSLTMGVYIVHPIVISYLSKILIGSSAVINAGRFFGATIISFSIIFVLDKIPVIKKCFLTI